MYEEELAGPGVVLPVVVPGIVGPGTVAPGVMAPTGGLAVAGTVAGQWWLLGLAAIGVLLLLIVLSRFVVKPRIETQDQ